MVNVYDFNFFDFFLIKNSINTPIFDKTTKKISKCQKGCRRKRL